MKSSAIAILFAVISEVLSKYGNVSYDKNDFVNEVKASGPGENDLQKLNFTFLDVKRSLCVKLGETIYIKCIPENTSWSEYARLRSAVSHGFWKNEQGRILPEGAAEPQRYAIDDRLILQIRDLKSEDSGILSCTLIMKTKAWIVSSMTIMVYDVPKFGLEFPLLFRIRDRCQENVERVVESLNLFQKFLCGSQSLGKAYQVCQYEVGQVACKRPPSTNDSIRGQNVKFMEVVIRKVPHPKFRPPFCHDLCSRVYYMQHINSNLEKIMRAAQRTYLQEFNFSFVRKVYPTKMFTMRRYFHACPPGFSLKKECDNDSAVCLPCEPGSFSDGSTNRCDKCPVDTFQDRFGADACLPCPAGKITGISTGSRHGSFCYRVHPESMNTNLLIACLSLFVLCTILLCFAAITILIDGWCPMRARSKMLMEIE